MTNNHWIREIAVIIPRTIRQSSNVLCIVGYLVSGNKFQATHGKYDRTISDIISIIDTLLGYLKRSINYSWRNSWRSFLFIGFQDGVKTLSDWSATKIFDEADGKLITPVGIKYSSMNRCQNSISSLLLV